MDPSSLQAFDSHAFREVVHEINNANNLAMLNASLLQRLAADISPLLGMLAESHPDLRLGNLPLATVRKELPSILASLGTASERIRVATLELRDRTLPLFEKLP